MGLDQLEEQAGAAEGDRQVADLIENEQAGAAEETDLVEQPSLALDRRTAVDAVAGRHRGDAQSGGEMALAGAGQADRQKAPRSNRFTSSKAVEDHSAG